MSQKLILNTEPPPSHPYWLWGCWLACSLIVLTSLWLRSRLYIGGDVAFYLFVADKLLHGGRYYYDFFEYNLPLVLYIVTIPVFIANHLALSPIPVYVGFTTLTSLASITLCAQILKGSEVYAKKPTYYILIVATCFVFFLPSTTLRVNEIGDKSFFMLAFVMPYFFSCFPRQESMRPALTAIVGILAGVGFCLKPHYFLIWAAMELYLMSKNRNIFYGWRTMNFMIAAVTLAYVLCLIFIIPEYLQLILPLVPYLYPQKIPYLHIIPLWKSLLLTFSKILYYLYLRQMWLVLILFLIVASRKQSKLDEAREILLYGFIVAYVELAAELQPGFQKMQIDAFAVLLVFKLIAEIIEDLKYFSLPRFGIAFFLLWMLAIFPYQELDAAYSRKESLAHSFMDYTLPYAERYAKDNSFLVISSDLGYAFPLVNYLDLRWNYKFANVPAERFWQYEKADQSQFTPDEFIRFQKARQYFYTALDDAMESTPSLIIAMEKREYPNKDDDASKVDWNFPQNFLKDKIFAREWKHYKKISEVTRVGYWGATITMGIYIRQ